jgi:hypothetical protein
LHEALLTAAASATCDPRTSPGPSSSTPSPGLRAGRSRCGSQAGQMDLRFGPAPVPANPSAPPAAAAGPPTSATCGPSGSASSASADLQSCLASRLRALTDSRGSTLYRLTWKERATPLGRRICALRASAPRTSGSGCTSWPSPKARDCHGGSPERATRTHPGPALNDAATLAPWPAPRVGNGGTGSPERADNRKARLEDTVFLATPGPMPSGSPAETDGSGQLNPSMSRWLMGYPDSWDTCAPKKTRRRA